MSSTKIIETTTVEEKQGQDAVDPTLQAFEDFMEGVGGGCAIEIYRFEPKELEGFLESVPVVNGEKPISLSYLAQRWGGKVLRLMLRDESGKFISRKLIPLKSYPPRLEGEDIEQNPKNKTEKNTNQSQYDPFDLFLKMQEVANRNLEAHKPPPSPDITGLLSQIIPALLTGLLNRPEPKIQTVDDTLRQLAMMKQFLTVSSEGGQSEEQSLLPFIMSMSDKLMSAKPEPKKLSAPQQIPNTVPINKINQNENINPTSVIEYVKQLKGDDAASAIFAALQQMPEEEAEKTIENLMKGFGFVDEENSNDSPENVEGED